MILMYAKNIDRNFENIMLNERSQTQKTSYCMIPFMWMSEEANSQTQKISSGHKLMGGKNGECLLDRCCLSFGILKMFWVAVKCGYNIVNILKTPALKWSKWQILCYINFISQKRKCFNSTPNTHTNIIKKNS